MANPMETNLGGFHEEVPDDIKLPPGTWCSVSLDGGAIHGKITMAEILFGRIAVRLEAPEPHGLTVRHIFADAIEIVTERSEAEVRARLTGVCECATCLARRMAEKVAPKSAANPCTNGTCKAPQAADCSNLFCPACCEEKCDGNCVRAVKDSLAEDVKF